MKSATTLASTSKPHRDFSLSTLPPTHLTRERRANSPTLAQNLPDHRIGEACRPAPRIAGGALLARRDKPRAHVLVARRGQDSRGELVGVARVREQRRIADGLRQRT